MKQRDQKSFLLQSMASVWHLIDKIGLNPVNTTHPTNHHLIDTFFEDSMVIISHGFHINFSALQNPPLAITDAVAAHKSTVYIVEVEN